MTRAIAAACVVALLGCFSKPTFDGPLDDAGSIDDAPDAVDADVDAASPYTHNVAFVTSVVNNVAALGSVAAVDAMCNTLAEAAKLPKNNYVAWLSSPAGSAPQRLRGGRGWVRVDGRPFADTVAQLIDGTIYHPLRLDENRMDRGGATVATATTEFGQPAQADCDGFTSGGMEAIAVGVSDATRRRWTDNATTVSCTTNVRFYCLGTDLDTPLTITPVMGRRAFLSTSVVVPKNGASEMDTYCALDAATNGLLGTYVALLASANETAASRLNVAAEPWVRLDGIPLSLTGQDLIDGTVLTSLNVDASGAYVHDVTVWTGISAQTGLTAPASSNCMNWTSNDVSSTAYIGNVVRTTPLWYRSANAQACNVGRRLYCFEQ